MGRDSAAAIRLHDRAVSLRHCSIAMENGQAVVRDHQSGSGTFVNGLRVSQHVLEEGDHISLGDSTFVFRSGGAVSLEDSPRKTLLRACSLLFLVRGFDSTREEALDNPLEGPILRLLSDFFPVERGFFLLARNETDLRALARQRAAGESAVVEKVCAEGSLLDPAAGTAAAAIFVHGAPVGVLSIQFAAASPEILREHGETLDALVTLISLSLSSEREVESLRTENRLLEQQLGTRDTGIVGDSEPIKRLLQMIERVAPRETTVLILGESGTGKELVARAIHAASLRRADPFVAINCAALTETLLESELFGHEKGAFTGAVAQKKGKLEMAEGGTMFLDEIGEMAPNLQAKLLRVLQQREFERVGGTRTMHLNVRLVAATNRDLAAEVKKGAFREDLYHRLNVVSLRTPPLRERVADIPLLARYFLAQAANRCGRKITDISPEAQQCLIEYAWPGNVRELENAIERAVVLGESETIQPEDLPETVLEAPAGKSPLGVYQDSVGDAKRDAILRAWQQGGGDYKAAARILGIHPNSLLRLVRNLGLRDLLKA